MSYSYKYHFHFVDLQGNLTQIFNQEFFLLLKKKNGHRTEKQSLTQTHFFTAK